MPMNETMVTVVIVASAIVTIVTTFHSASAAIFMVYRIFRPENEAPALAPRLGHRDVLPPPIHDSSPEARSPGAILPRVHGFFRHGGLFSAASPRQLLSTLAAVCHLITATTSLMSASATIRHYWRRWTRRDRPRRTIRIQGGVAPPTHVSVATSPIPSTTTLSPVPSQASVSHLLQLKDAIESAITYTDQGVKLRLGTRNCNKVACKPGSMRRKLSLLYGKDNAGNKQKIATGMFNVAQEVLEENDIQIGEYADQAQKVMDDTLTTVNAMKDAESYDNFAKTLAEQARLAMREHNAILSIQEGNEELGNRDDNHDSPIPDFQLSEDNASAIYQELFQTNEITQKMDEYLPNTEELTDRIQEIVKSIDDVRQEYTRKIEGIVTGNENLDTQRDKTDYPDPDDSWEMGQEVIRQFDVGEEMRGYIDHATDIKDNVLSHVKSAGKIVKESEEKALEIITSIINLGDTQLENHHDGNMNNNAWGTQETIHETAGLTERLIESDESKDSTLSVETNNVLQENNEDAAESTKVSENQGAIKKVRRHLKANDNAVGTAEDEHHAKFGNQRKENERSDEFRGKTHAAEKSDDKPFENSKQALESGKLIENQGAIKKDKRYLKTDDNARESDQDVFYETVQKQIGQHIEGAEIKDNADAVLKSTENVLQKYRDKVEENIKRAQSVYDTVRSELLENLDQLPPTGENTDGTSAETLLQSQIKKNDEEYLKYATEIKDKAYEVVRNVDELIQNNSGIKVRRRHRRKSTIRSLSKVRYSRKNKESEEDDDNTKVIVCVSQCDRECSKRDRKDSGIQTSVETTEVGCSPSTCDKICYSCTHLDTANPNPYQMNDAKSKIERSRENINEILKELTKNSLIVFKKKRWPNRSECVLQKRKEEAKSGEPLRPESAGARKREEGPRRRNSHRYSNNEFTSMSANRQTPSSPEECKGMRYYEDGEFIRSDCSTTSLLHGLHSRHHQRRDVDIIESSRESIKHQEVENEFPGMAEGMWFTSKLVPVGSSLRWEPQENIHHDDHGSSRKFYERKHSLTSQRSYNYRNTSNTVPVPQEKILQINQDRPEHQFEFNSNRHQIKIPPDTYVYRRFPKVDGGGKAHNVKFVQDTTPALITNVKTSFKTPIGRDRVVTATYSSKEALSQRNNEIIQNIKKELGLCSNVDEPELVLPSPSQATNQDPHSYPRKKILISKKRCQTNKVDWGKKYSDRFKHLLSRIETGKALKELVVNEDEPPQHNEGKVAVIKYTPCKSPKHRSCEIIWRRDIRPDTPNPSTIQVNITHDYFPNTLAKNRGTTKYTNDSSIPKHNSAKSDTVCGRMPALHFVIPAKFDSCNARNKCEARPHHRG